MRKDGNLLLKVEVIKKMLGNQDQQLSLFPLIFIEFPLGAHRFGKDALIQKNPDGNSVPILLTNNLLDYFNIWMVIYPDGITEEVVKISNILYQKVRKGRHFLTSLVVQWLQDSEVFVFPSVF